MIRFVMETSKITHDLVRDANARGGKFRVEDIPADRRGKLRNIGDIASTDDATALCAVLMACLSRDSKVQLDIPGVNFELVDKVRNIRNDYSHHPTKFIDDNYTNDSLRAIDDLRKRLLAAGGRATSRSRANQSRATSVPRARTQSSTPQINATAVNRLEADIDAHLKEWDRISKRAQDFLAGHSDFEDSSTAFNSFRTTSKTLLSRSSNLYRGMIKRQSLLGREKRLNDLLLTLGRMESLVNERRDGVRKLPADLQSHLEDGTRIAKEAEILLAGSPAISELERILERFSSFWTAQASLRQRSSDLYPGASKPQNVRESENRIQDLVRELRRLEELAKARESERRRAEFPENLRRHLEEGKRIREEAEGLLTGRSSLSDLRDAIEGFRSFRSTLDELRNLSSSLYEDDAELPRSVTFIETELEDLLLYLKRLEADLERKEGQRHRDEERHRLFKKIFAYAAVVIVLLALGAGGWQLGAFGGNGDGRPPPLQEPAAPQAPAPAPAAMAALPIPTDTPTPTPTSTRTPTPTPTNTPIPTFTFTPTATSTLSPTPTSTVPPTATSTPSPTPTPTVPPGATPTPAPCTDAQARLVERKTHDAPYCIRDDGQVGPPPDWESEVSQATPGLAPSPEATPMPTSPPVPSPTPISRCEEEDLQPGADLSDCNFAGKDMRGLDLTDVTLTAANMASAKFNDAILIGADLTDANLTGADLTDADLTSAVLAGADMTGALVEGVILPRVDLSSTTVEGIESLNRANLRRVTFPSEAQLIDVTFNYADLSHASLIGANLEKANFANASLNHANLSDANLKNAILKGVESVKGITLDGAGLQNAVLAGVDFGEIYFDNNPDFRGADLRNVSFYEADLNGVDFSGADLADANFSKADLTGAIFVNVKDLEDADFSEATLTGANFAGAGNVGEARFDDTICSDGVESDSCYLEGRLHGVRP